MTDPLIGRDAVLADLAEAVTASGDRGQALLVVGERGIGRTACLQAARETARAHGLLVVETAGTEAETNLPFAGLHRLLRPLLGSVGALPPVQRDALLAALGLGDATSGDSLVVCLAALTLLGRAAGRAGVLVTADDLHWLDRPTRQVLAFVARRLDAQPIRLVASTSARDARQSADGTFRIHHLRRLDEADAHRLIARRAPGLHRAQRVWVVAEAAGNPLALLELAATAATVDVAQLDPVTPGWTLPPRLERAFGGSLDALPGAARDAVLVAAVALDGRLSEIIAATSLLRADAADLSVLDVPQARGLLEVDEARVRLRHPLVRAAILQQEPVSRRQAAHRALGAVITLSARRRAWHRAAGATAHDDVVAADLEATTVAGLGRGDGLGAIGALERAAQLSTVPAERGRRLLLAARQAARLGRPETVLRLVSTAVGGDLAPFDRVRAELLRADCDGSVIADSSRVLKLCRAARRAAAAGEAVLAVELADAAVRRRCVAPVDSGALTELTSLAEQLVRTRPGDARALAVYALADPLAHGRAVLEALPDTDSLSLLDGDALGAFGVAARAVGHYVAALAYLDRAEVSLRAGGLLGPLGRNLCVAADLRVEVGEWDRAAAALLAFASLSAGAMSASHRASALATSAKLAALRGDAASALDLVAHLEQSPDARSGSRSLARLQTVRGIAYLSAGRHDDAFDALRRVVDPDDPTHHFREHVDAVAYLAEAAARTGRQQEVRSAVERVRAIADVSGSPVLATQLAYADAVLAPDAVAERAFLAGLAHDASGSPWPRARLQLAYGRWLRRQQRVTESRGPLQAALGVLARLGAVRWAAEAADEVRAAGTAVDPAGPAPSLSLSAQELRIARLAAQGLSNRQIGDEMYLSPRTVSSHLYRIFPKLGISTRGQLAERLP